MNKESAVSDAVQVTQADRDAADKWKREWEHCRGSHTALVQAFARHRLAAARQQPGEPVAYLHTLHMEGGQTYTRITEDDGADPDCPDRTGFGRPGRDYSEEYRVTTEPLYRTPPQHPGECCRRALEDAAEVAERCWADMAGTIQQHEDREYYGKAVAQHIRALTPPAQAASPADASGDEALVEEYSALVTFGGEVGSTLVPADLSKRVLEALAAKEPRP